MLIRAQLPIPGSSAAGLAATRAMDRLQALKRPPVATKCTSSSRGGGGGTEGCKQGAWLLNSGAMGPTPGRRHFNRSDLTKPLVFESHAWRVELCNATGAIIGLQRRADAIGRGGGSAAGSPLWAAPGWPLAQVVYSTYSEDDYSIIWERYAYRRDADSSLPLWFYRDFGKPGATTLGGARRADHLPALQAVFWRASPAGGLRVVAQAQFDPGVVRDAGAPARLYIELRSPPGTPELLLDVGWERKTPTRLPEALWVRWRPPVAATAGGSSGGGGGQPTAVVSEPAAGGVDPSSWLLYKLGQPISPLEVLLNGSRSLHAVGDEGVSVAAAAADPNGAGVARTAAPCSGGGGAGQTVECMLHAGASWAIGRGGGGDGGTAARAPPRLRIRSLDAALASPGRPMPFPNLREQPDLTEGISFCLVNNIWCAPVRIAPLQPPRSACFPPGAVAAGGLPPAGPRTPPTARAAPSALLAPGTQGH